MCTDKATGRGKANDASVRVLEGFRVDLTTRKEHTTVQLRRQLLHLPHYCNDMPLDSIIGEAEWERCDSVVRYSDQHCPGTLVRADLPIKVYYRSA
jgi:hypothetical protein